MEGKTKQQGGTNLLKEKCREAALIFPNIIIKNEVPIHCAPWISDISREIRYFEMQLDGETFMYVPTSFPIDNVAKKEYSTLCIYYYIIASFGWIVLLWLLLC